MVSAVGSAPFPFNCHGNTSEQASFGEGNTLTIANDQVIENTNIHQGQGLLEALGDAQIGLAGLGDPGGMVVGEDDGGGAEFEGASYHLPWVDAGAVEGAIEEFLVS